jgi:hypothetical protein
LGAEAQYQNYHRVLNRAVWSSRKLSDRLLRQVVAAFVPADRPLVLGLDDHIERRHGEKIAAKGIYRDGVRSSQSHFVKTSGLRWVSMMVQAEKEHKHSQGKLYASEIVTLALLYALKGSGQRAFWRWLVRDYRPLFPHLPSRTRLFRLFNSHQPLIDEFLAEPALAGVHRQLKESFP